MKDFPHKWPDESFIENDKFMVEKIVAGSALELSKKGFFGQVLIKNMG